MKLTMAALMTVVVMGITVPAVAQTAAPRSQIEVLERLSAAAREAAEKEKRPPTNTYDTFLSLLRTAGISDMLAGKTVVAPSDAAFERLGPDAVAALRASGNGDALKAFIAAHTLDQIALPETLGNCICAVERGIGTIRIGTLQPGGFVVDVDGRAPAWTNGDRGLARAPKPTADRPDAEVVGAVLGIRGVLHYTVPKPSV
jgi:uncharacterized surface protein with fasciclin (FAS1) repeats